MSDDRRKRRPTADEAIDAAAERLVRGRPSEDFERRVMARIRGQQQPRAAAAAWRPLWAAAAVVGVGVLLVHGVRRPKPVKPEAPVADSGAPPRLRAPGRTATAPASAETVRSAAALPRPRAVPAGEDRDRPPFESELAPPPLEVGPLEIAEIRTEPAPVEAVEVEAVEIEELEIPPLEGG